MSSHTCRSRSIDRDLHTHMHTCTCTHTHAPALRHTNTPGQTPASYGCYMAACKVPAVGADREGFRRAHGHRGQQHGEPRTANQVVLASPCGLPDVPAFAAHVDMHACRYDVAMQICSRCIYSVVEACTILDDCLRRCSLCSVGDWGPCSAHCALFR